MPKFHPLKKLFDGTDQKLTKKTIILVYNNLYNLF